MEIKIGKQIWMTENLKTTHYQNGDIITNVTSAKSWSKLNSGARCTYKNKEDYNKIFGFLYNWYAVNDPRGLAPSGWRIPSNEDWKQLVDFLGGYWVAGAKLKAMDTWHWFRSDTIATNETGFSALSAGLRDGGSGYFRNVGKNSYFWSSTEASEDYAYFRGLFFFSHVIYHNYLNKQFGFSVRCIKN